MKHIKKYKKSYAISFSVLILVIISIVLLNFGNATSPGDDASLDDKSAYSNEIAADKEMSAESRSDDGSNNSGGVNTSLYYVPLSMDELIEQSTLVIYGYVTHAESIYIQAVNESDIQIFTDYYIDPISILRGKPINEDEVVVRMRGGETEEYGFVSGFMDPLNVGDEYLLFLYRPEMGGGCETRDNHYYIQGMDQGIFEVTVKKSIKDTSGNTVPAEFSSRVDESSEDRLDFKEFESKILKANIDTPVDTYLFRETVLENWKANLDSGFFTQEEYDQRLQEYKQYATIVKSLPVTTDD